MRGKWKESRKKAPYKGKHLRIYIYYSITMQLFFMYDKGKVGINDLLSVRDRLITEQGFQLHIEELDVIRKNGQPPIDIRFHHDTAIPMIHFEPVPEEFMKTEDYRRAINTVSEMLPYERIVDASNKQVSLEILLNST